MDNLSNALRKIFMVIIYGSLYRPILQRDYIKTMFPLTSLYCLSTLFHPLIIRVDSSSLFYYYNDAWLHYVTVIVIRYTANRLHTWAFKWSQQFCDDKLVAG